MNQESNYNSAVCGFFGANGGNFSLDEISIEDQFGYIDHRGPDGRGLLRHENCVLGHTLLAIQDPGNAAQPMSSKSGRLAIVFNGEIYNCSEIIKRYCLKNLETHSDTELLVELIDSYGFETLSKLEGMFAFAILNKDLNQVTLGRDRFGEKPLFFASKSNNIYFGSNPIAVSKMAKTKLELNNLTLAHFFKYQYMPEGLSPFEGVTQIEPGTLLHHRPESGIKLEKFKLNLNKKSQDYSFRDLFSDCVKSCMVSDVPIGLALSGGIDSTITLFEMTKYSPKINTFTVKMENNYQDATLARQAAKMVGAVHHEIQIEGSEMATLIFEVLSNQTLPFGDSSMIPTFALSRFAKQKVKVLLSGDGADEILSGYNYYRKYGGHRSNNLRTIPRYLRLKFENLARTVLDKRDFSKIEKLKELELYLGIKSAFDLWNEDIACLTDKELFYLFGRLQKVLKLSRTELIEFQDVQSVMSWDRTTYLPGDILWKGDSAGMMASLEIRTPFLNSKLVQWAEKQDFSKLHSKQTLMMSIYGEEIPPMFFSRKKSGFGAPLSSWFQNREVEIMYLDYVGNSKSKVYEFIDYQRAAKLSKRNIQFKWNLLALTLWLNRNA